MYHVYPGTNTDKGAFQGKVRGVFFVMQRSSGGRPHGGFKPHPDAYAEAYAQLKGEPGLTERQLKGLKGRDGPLDIFRAQLGIKLQDDSGKHHTKAELIAKLLEKQEAGVKLPTVRATTRARTPCPRPLPPRPSLRIDL